MRPLIAPLTPLLLLVLLGCPPPPKPPCSPLPPPVSPTCGDACSHWRSLGCAEGDASPGGASCEQVCANLQASGIVSLDLACSVAVENCGSIRTCEKQD